MYGRFYFKYLMQLTFQKQICYCVIYFKAYKKKSVKVIKSDKQYRYLLKVKLLKTKLLVYSFSIVSHILFRL